jgi:hypothetical protein
LPSARDFLKLQDDFFARVEVSTLSMESNFKDFEMPAKGSGPCLVAILAQLLAYGLRVFLVAPHPESDSASTRVHRSSATHGKELCQAASRKLQFGTPVQQYHFLRAAGSGSH